MTFTEAAVEVLRRSGRPLHFKDIAQQAVDAGLLSHVGVTPEATMGARLLALARREHDRRVVATETGVFGLAEWGVGPAVPELGEPTPEELAEQAGPPLRTRERHPELRDEHVVGARRDDRRRGRGEDEGRQRRKRYGPPAELAHEWLLRRGSPASLADVVAGLRSDDRIAEALERDLESFEKALREENRRRADAGRTPMFEFLDDGAVKALEMPREQPKQREQKGPPPAKGERVVREEPIRVAAFDEQRRTVIRSVRRRLSNLDVSGLERVVVALLEAQGYRELNMARRSAKEGPLYLARRKWGAGELRYAVRVLKPGRDLGRTEVQELRKDVGHYSSQIGIVFGAGECSREAKSEGNTPGGVPVLLYGSEALAEALIEVGLGVRRRMVEWLDFDEEFFNSVGGEELPETEGAPPPAPPQPERQQPERQQQERQPLTDEMREERQRRREEQRARRAGRREQEAAAARESTPSETPETTGESAPAPGEVAAISEATEAEFPTEASLPVETVSAADPAPEQPPVTEAEPAPSEPVPPQD